MREKERGGGKKGEAGGGGRDEITHRGEKRKRKKDVWARGPNKNANGIETSVFVYLCPSNVIVPGSLFIKNMVTS